MGLEGSSITILSFPHLFRVVVNSAIHVTSVVKKLHFRYYDDKIGRGMRGVGGL